MQNISIKKEEWDKTIEQMLLSFTVFAATENEYSLDFEKIYPSSIGMIS